jgi:hypothetical protein
MIQEKEKMKVDHRKALKVYQNFMKENFEYHED